MPFPPPRDLPNPGVEPRRLLSPALAGGLFTTGATWEAHVHMQVWIKRPGEERGSPGLLDTGARHTVIPTISGEGLAGSLG